LPTAIRYYERARSMDASLAGLATAAITRVQARIVAEGADAFKRAREHDAANRVEDAIIWYERALKILPESSPDRRTASDRLRALKSGR
jgi:tetratricopeptide (TPR) repeat protein